MKQLLLDIQLDALPSINNFIVGRNAEALHSLNHAINPGAEKKNWDCEYKKFSCRLNHTDNGKHPFDERQVPVICGEHVTTEAGTGLVHTAAAHGNDDWLVMRAHFPNEKPRVLIGADGKFFTSDLVELPEIRGLSRQDANKVILGLMQENVTLLASARLNHSFPHCWRHKTPLMQLATHQWFIGMNETDASGKSLREYANQAVDNTEFFPSWGRARLEAMIKNRPDWCVSRQRNWGVPMPLFVHKETGEKARG